ncbi:MAG: hypothetical protein AAF961_10780, partial [Planctomycetota bacterium]
AATSRSVPSGARADRASIDAAPEVADGPFEATGPNDSRPPPAPPAADKVTVLHGFEDLSPDEQARLREQLARAHQRPQPQRYVHVDGDDLLAQSFLEAVANEAKAFPRNAEVAQRIERNAWRYYQHKEANQRIESRK